MGRMMVEIPIPNKWKELWNIWDLRAVIILSLSLQTFLIFVAPLRKRVKSNWIVIPLWITYLLADWAANFAVGLISSSQGNPGNSSGKKQKTVVENEDLLAFWAPFLLVHLGGPDTITAYALEDNELWRRHLIGLFFQCLAAVYVFVQSLPKNGLWIPTMVMFMTGIIKYAERTRALYLASADKFKQLILTRADPGPNYAKLMEKYVSKKKALLPTQIIMIPEPDRAAKIASQAKRGDLTEREMVQYGYQFYLKFRGLIVDTTFSRNERYQSRYFFLNRNATDAFKVVEVELNFMYDVLFTKLPVVFAKNKIGVVSRVFSLVTICVGIILFLLKSKTNYKEADVTITYSLLFGALVLDTSALIMILISDWTIISIQESSDVDEPIDKSFMTKILTLLTEGMFGSPKCGAKKPKSTGEPESNEKPKCRGWRFRVKKHRWSESVSTFNLINYCLNKHHPYIKKVFDKLGLSDFLDGIFYVGSETFTTYLRDFIFDELKSKSDLAEDLETAKEISSAHGDWVLRVEEGWSDLLKIIGDVNYDQSLILWHLATEICYNDPDQDEKKNTNRNRENAKLLSDYMLNLLIMQPGLMSAVAGIGQIRFQDTCEEVKRLVTEKKVVKPGDKSADDRNVPFDNQWACMEILKVPTDVEPISIKGDKSKSVLFDSCILAKKLMEIEIKDKEQMEMEGKEPRLDKWVIISKVWVELLCYAASHSRANMQAAQVSKGGELITIVWLLMTHFGLGDQFQIKEGQPIAKLIVGK